jgi:hypothetical protein
MKFRPKPATEQEQRWAASLSRLWLERLPDVEMPDAPKFQRWMEQAGCSMSGSIHLVEHATSVIKHELCSKPDFRGSSAERKVRTV